MTASRAITNRYQDFQLLDLSKLMKRTQGRGPFLLVQEGCDPADPHSRECSFVLTRRGTWLHYYLFLALPETVRYRCAMFETGAEALKSAANLTGPVRVENAVSLQELIREHGFEPDPSDAQGRALWDELGGRHPGLKNLPAGNPS